MRVCVPTNNGVLTSRSFSYFHTCLKITQCVSIISRIYFAGGRILDRGGIDADQPPVWKSRLSTPITSVYFDSPTMSMYDERVKRSEGANLLRVRWYGPSRPGRDERVFLELKTHHECWIGDSSVKERVAVREGDVAGLLDYDDGERYVDTICLPMGVQYLRCTNSCLHSAKSLF